MFKSIWKMYPVIKIVYKREQIVQTIWNFGRGHTNDDILFTIVLL